jgi:two-component system C4-dicarboxylate transport sensor histidine kinase DctB
MVQLLLPLVILALSAAAYLFLTARAERQAMAQISQRANSTLDVQADAILTQLDKYRYLPSVIAGNSEIAGFFDSPDEPIARARVLHQIERIAANSGSIEVALALPSGKIVLGTGNFVETGSVENTELRIAPGQGRLGRASISSRAGQRAYGFSSGVGFGDHYRGFVIVIAPIEGIERAWALSDKPLFATNFADQIVARNFQAEELEEKVRAASLEPSGMRLITSSGGEQYQAFEKVITITGWKLHVLERLNPVVEAKQVAGTISLLGSALLGLIIYLGALRLQQQLIRERLERANALRLERKVAERTRELVQTNRLLEGEIAERRNAESALLQAQEGLIHAEKLAAIGKISATLAHEYNQPLAAIRTYSENAETYLQRGNSDKVQQNLTLISSLVDRLAGLSKTLLSFSRKSQPGLLGVTVSDAIEDALGVTQLKAQKEGVEIICNMQKLNMKVAADRLHLGQVFVNLINNGIDASRGASEKRIEIHLHKTTASQVLIRVRDHGPGVSSSVRNRLFEPFFTTKEVGSGLGLGLSIVVNTLKDIGGKLTVSNARDGGAIFTVQLARIEGSNAVGGQKTAVRRKPGDKGKMRTLVDHER